MHVNVNQYSWFVNKTSSSRIVYIHICTIDAHNHHNPHLTMGECAVWRIELLKELGFSIEVLSSAGMWYRNRFFCSQHWLAVLQALNHTVALRHTQSNCQHQMASLYSHMFLYFALTHHSLDVRTLCLRWWLRALRRWTPKKTSGCFLKFSM